MRQKKCKCGCGGIPAEGYAWMPKHRKRYLESLPIEYCGCGCGNVVRPGRKFCDHHSSKSPLIIKKIRRSLKDYVHSNETKERISQSLKDKGYRGKDSPNYRGTNDMAKYHPFVIGKDYRDLMDGIKTRDGNKCVLCKRKNVKLVAHHLVPIKVGYKSRLCDHPSNLILICRLCHLRVEHPRLFVKDRWIEILPEAKKHLSQFGYKKMLLDKYI